MKTIGIFVGLLLISMYGFAQTDADSIKTDRVYATDTTGITELSGDSVSVPAVNPLNDTLSVSLDTMVAVVKEPVVNPINRKVKARFYALLSQYRKTRQEMSERWDDIFIPHAPAWIRPDADYFKLAMPATYYSDAIKSFPGKKSDKRFSVPDTPSYAYSGCRPCHQPPTVKLLRTIS